MTPSKLRVVVVEDSLTIRRHICEVLAAAPGIEVVGEGEDGKQAIELCRDLRPDVMTLDMMLPVMSGLAATEYIMAYHPTPILVVSSSFNRGVLFRTYDALAAGAVDVLEKPNGREPEGSWEQRLVAAVRMVSRIRAITHPRARLGALGRQHATTVPPPMTGLTDAAVAPRRSYRVVAVGASTGGPGALVELLRGLPQRFPLPVLVVLHIGEPFSVAFAEWLDGLAGRRVSFARQGEPLLAAAGRVLLAPPGKHLIVQGGRVQLTDTPERHSCRPSVDVLFESVAREFGGQAIGGLLTGMGRDGAHGLLALRQAGAFTIAQDEATSVVYGMPREAVLLGAAMRVLPLSEIAPAITELTAMPTGPET